MRPTGYDVREASESWQVFRAAGIRVDIASVAGGRPPEDGRDDEDAFQHAYLSDPHIANEHRDSARSADVDSSAYDIVYFVGGHGAMWDFPHGSAIGRIVQEVGERGGGIAAVRHGPEALLGATRTDGSPFVAGRRVAAFTDAEVEAVGLTHIVPFLLADELVAQG